MPAHVWGTALRSQGPSQRPQHTLDTCMRAAEAGITADAGVHPPATNPTSSIPLIGSDLYCSRAQFVEAEERGTGPAASQDPAQRAKVMKRLSDIHLEAVAVLDKVQRGEQGLKTKSDLCLTTKKGLKGLRIKSTLQLRPSGEVCGA